MSQAFYIFFILFSYFFIFFIFCCRGVHFLLDWRILEGPWRCFRRPRDGLEASKRLGGLKATWTPVNTFIIDFVHQGANQTVTNYTKQVVDHVLDQSIFEDMNQSISTSIKQIVSRFVHQSADNHLIGRSIKQSSSHSIYQSSY